MKKIVVIILIGFMINSCNKDDCCTEINTRIDIKYTDNSGNNVLGANGGLDTANITVFYKENDVWKEFYDEHLSYPKGYFISAERGENYFYLYPSNYYTGNVSETKIQFSGGFVDSLKCQFEISDNSVICTKVFYNDELKWEGDGNTERIIEIKKDGL